MIGKILPLRSTPPVAVSDSAAVSSPQRNRDRFVFMQFLQRLFPPPIFVVEDPAHRGRTGSGRGVFCHFKLRAHRVVKIETRRRIVGGKNWHHHPDALNRESKIVAQQFRQRAHFSIHAHLLQLRAAEKLKRMFEHARHFPRRRRDTGDRHDGMTIDFQDFVGAIVNNGVACGGASIAGHEHATGKFESKNGGRFRLHPFRGVSDSRNIGCRREQTLSPQQRREIVTRPKRRLVECSYRPVHYWPVRWR